MGETVWVRDKSEVTEFPWKSQRIVPFVAIQMT